MLDKIEEQVDKAIEKYFGSSRLYMELDKIHQEYRRMAQDPFDRLWQ